MTAIPIQNLLNGLRTLEPPQEPDPSEAPVIVNELTSKAGRFYERIRYLFDYKEEHTIRRSAVERQLRRQLAVGNRDTVGKNLVQEFISGGYLPNRVVSEQTGLDVQLIVDRYLALDVHQNSRIRKRLLSLAATEIDRYLKPESIAELTLQSFYQTVSPQIQYTDQISPDTLSEQVYIASRRSLLEEDEDMLFYAVWRRHIPHLEHENLEELARHIPNIFKEIENNLRHLVGWQLIPRFKNYKIYFLLIKKILERYGSESSHLFTENAQLEPIAREILEEEYEKQYTVARKSGIRAIIYIFLTKILVALALEFPAEIFLYNEINYLALGSNVVVHPFLLFLMTRGLPKLHKEEIRKATEGVINVITGNDLEIIRVSERNRTMVFDIVLLLLYFALFLFSFGVIVSLLVTAGFNIISILLFLVFLTLVSYFGFRIRHNAKKWKVTGVDGAFMLLWRIFTLPVIRAGRWLSRTFSSINVFVFFMDFIIETPFKLALGLIDAFVSFLREKEEEIY